MNRKRPGDATAAAAAAAASDGRAVQSRVGG